MNEGSKVFLTTNGCPENRIDLARMREFLIENGWEVVDSLEESDLILFNACGLTSASEENSTRIISELNFKKKPSTELIVCGCLPQINNNRLREVYQNKTFRSDDIQVLANALNIKTNPDNTYANYLLPRYSDAYKNGRRIPNLKKLFSMATIKKKLFFDYYRELCEAINVFHPYSFCIKISTGCLTNCSYCAVRISRGTLKSKPLNKVVHEFEDGIAKGFTEFSLIGTDTGSYGRDQGITLVTLLRELLTRGGNYQIRLRNIQPRFLIEMMPDLRDLFKSGKISYIGTAVQSGNNRILKLMNRKYTIEEYKEAIRLINEEFPHIQIRTQIMVGFPSETEEEYQDSVRLLDELSFDIVEVYLYSPRPNTKAAKIKEQVPRKVAEKRHSNLLLKSIFNNKEKKKKGLEIYKEELNKWQQMAQMTPMTYFKGVN
jgi:threonylcarbamoyladenosine tRNA methylthiotransferase CDKAL1